VYVVYTNPDDFPSANELHRCDAEGNYVGLIAELPVYATSTVAFDSAGAIYVADRTSLLKVRIQE